MMHLDGHHPGDSAGVTRGVFFGSRYLVVGGRASLKRG